jgi:hypothetical protein
MSAPKFGAPSLSPSRYFRIHMVGYFEGIHARVDGVRRAGTASPSTACALAAQLDTTVGSAASSATILRQPKRGDEMNDFVARIVAMANANDEAMRAHLRMEGGNAHMDEVWKIIDSADVVFGIWQDPTGPEGVGYLVIKGEHLLPDVVADGAARSHIINAISCQEAAQAYALHDLCLQRLSGER